MTILREMAWVDPLHGFEPLAARRGALLLDSALVEAQLGRWTLLALEPFATLQGKVGQGFLLEGEPLGLDPFAAAREALGRWRVEPLARAGAPAGVSLPPFRGGMAGYWAYDLARSIERLPEQALDDLDFPDLSLGLYDTVAAFDLLERRAWVVSTGLPEGPGARRRRRAEARADELEAALASSLPTPDGPVPLPRAVPRVARAAFSREAYEAAVARVIAYIRAGDIFQANLSQRFDVDLLADETPFDVYRRLRAVNPAPFSAYVSVCAEGGERVLVSSSPERFLKLSGDVVETRPIKGTRPRGSSREHDDRLAHELVSSAKERAENVMIVDLLRNDLSKVCRDHSVTVEALCVLTRYPTVQHLVSTVSGQLAAGQDALSLLRACFPGGSISGAPKVRAMEVIEALEPTRRGPYCGAIGYVGFDGAMDTSIAIRTILCAGRRASYQVGGGIVAASDPAHEREETLIKGRALAQALGA